MNLIFKRPDDREFEQISHYIQEFELDNRNLQKEQFITALHTGMIVGFGRLKRHSDCMELCSLGVIPSHRKKGIGKAVVAELIKQCALPVYLVCIIPDFFTPFGFKKVTNYPISIKNKLIYCTHELVVPEKYFPMCLLTN